MKQYFDCGLYSERKLHPSLFAFSSVAHELFHHFVHLLVLLEEAVNFFDGSSGACRDTLLARSIEYFRMLALSDRHRQNDGLGTAECTVIDIGIAFPHNMTPFRMTADDIPGSMANISFILPIFFI